MTEQRPDWNEARIHSLQGQEETIRLEFKSGRLLDADRSQWVEKLSRGVSAFANTEGGTILVGVGDERLGVPKRRVAGHPDGVENGRVEMDELRCLVEGHLSPYLPGVRVYRVPLTSQPGRSVIVIDVPAGTTAYQASDKMYYGRSELGARPLPDHEIRLRMSRGKVARASVELRAAGVSRARPARDESEFPQDPSGSGTLQRDIDAFCAGQPYDEVQFDAVLRNDGEVTLREPLLTLEVVDRRLLQNRGLDLPWMSALKLRKALKGTILYPADHSDIPTCGSLRWKGNAVIEPSTCVVRWSVFLDNSPPSRGEVDVGVLAHEARAGQREPDVSSSATEQ